jgi:hypothetical protein
VAALVSALPVLRPWEYFNESVSVQNAWRYFGDEGVDLGQRVPELARYYKEQLKPAGEIPYDEYGVTDEEEKRRSLELRSHKKHAGDESAIVTGTFFISAQWLHPRRLYDYEAFRRAQPVARFGNLLVYRGTFYLPWVRARNLFEQAIDKLYLPTPDEAQAERLLSESVALYPQAYGVSVELGNLLAARGARAEAICAYELAKQHAPPGDALIPLLAQQIRRIATEPPAAVPPLRNPWLE